MNYPLQYYTKTQKNFTAPCLELEARIRHKLIQHSGDPCLRWQVTNAVVTRKVDGSLLPKKETSNSQNKIDGLDAMINCIAGYMADQEEDDTNIDDVIGKYGSGVIYDSSKERRDY